MKPNLKFGLKGHFTLVVSGPRGIRVYEAPNLILGAGIDRALSSANSLHGHVQIGTGNAAVAITDTQLQNRIASTSTQNTGFLNTYVAGPPDYVETTITYRFALGALNSAISGNFAEVGIGWASSGSLWSRALITDSGGSPTTISVLADEQLDVIYRLRLYPIQSDVAGSITLNSVSYNYVIRPSSISSVNYGAGSCYWGAGAAMLAGVGLFTTMNNPTSSNTTPFAYTGGLAARTALPTGLLGSASTTKNEPLGSYTNGSYQRARRNTWELNDAVGNIKTLTLAAGGAGNVAFALHQIEFTPVVPKLSTQRLTLDFTYSFGNRP